MVFAAVAIQKILKPLVPTHILGETFEAAESVWNLGVVVDLIVCRSCVFDFAICGGLYSTNEKRWLSQQQMHLSVVD